VKADLFVGSNAAGGFAAATLKMRQGLVQGGQGLALAIYPGSDRNRPIDPYLDNELNLVRVPLPYQNSFTEQFGFALRITRTFLESRNATTPPWTKLPGSDERAVCRQLEQRREESFVEAVNFLRAAASTPLPVISNSSPRMST
jgi:hypothetical protein